MTLTGGGSGVMSKQAAFSLHGFFLIGGARPVLIGLETLSGKRLETANPSVLLRGGFV